VIALRSDVDENIPVTKKRADKTLALVIANENYKHVTKVPAARADGTIFAEYCRRTLGIPETNVAVYTDASYAELLDAVSDLQRKADVLGPEAEIILYYAGHGLPDENTKDAYLLSTDANPSNPRTWYRLGDLYSTLAGINSAGVMVFIDACFSGAEREGGMLAAPLGARAVAIKAKEAAPKGNMFVLTAASGNETALPYKEKNHGMFTYYLLRKIQESKGNVTLKDLSDYVIENVRRQSNFINHKPQTPTVTTSGQMVNDYKSRKIVK
ncbi:MAG: caspase family protein, partial [Muribaculaceae bacterium]|nr:caspase family protein [Muribaculaceae bacterium]